MSSGLTSSYTEAWLPGYDGTQFFTRTYPSASPCAVLLYLHGFAEHIARYEWAHSLCASRGVTVFSFDQRGFGRTALDTSHKSKKSTYGKTNLHNQLNDIEWWLKHLHKEYPELPLFTMGHSMGGALCLAFVTRPSPPPSKEAVSLVSGVIPSSTMLLQTVSASKPLRFIGEKLSTVLPKFLLDVVKTALENDPLIIQKGTLRGLSDMLNVGEQMWKSDYKNWPRHLPVMFVHGNEDRVTSFQAAHDFYENIQADDKQFNIVEGGYHELVNEPKDMREKFMDDCITWILDHAKARATSFGTPNAYTSSKLDRQTDHTYPVI
ncbi:lysophospholipase [Trametes meyenii]|nr:lysophospholipase [Trametes meyenii]